MKDDFPVPLRPTRPTFSPAPTTKEASESRVRSPISMVRADPTITTHCTSGNTCSIHSANARSRPQVVDPDRRLHGDLHAPARHHGRERGAARHPAVAALELLRPAVGRRRLLADAGRLPADRRRRWATSTAGGRSSPIGLVVFSLASLLCGLSTTPLMLNLARAVQGVGGAIMFATSLALIAGAFVGRDRGTAFGIYGAVIGGAVAIGPADRRRHHERHRLALDLLRQRAHRRRRRHHHVHQDRRVQGPAGAPHRLGRLRHVLGQPLRAWCSRSCGATTSAGAARPSSGLLVASAVLMVAFFVNELHTRDPMLDLGLFRIPAFVGLSVVAFTLAASIFAMFLYLTLYIQDDLGYGPLAAGIRFLPMTLRHLLLVLLRRAPDRAGAVALPARHRDARRHRRRSSRWGRPTRPRPGPCCCPGSSSPASGSAPSTRSWPRAPSRSCSPSAAAWRRAPTTRSGRWASPRASRCSARSSRARSWRTPRAALGKTASGQRCCAGAVRSSRAPCRPGEVHQVAAVHPDRRGPGSAAQRLPRRASRPR